MIRSHALLLSSLNDKNTNARVTVRYHMLDDFALVHGRFLFHPVQYNVRTIPLVKLELSVILRTVLLKFSPKKVLAEHT